METSESFGHNKETGRGKHKTTKDRQGEREYRKVVSKIIEMKSSKKEKGGRD